MKSLTEKQVFILSGIMIGISLLCLILSVVGIASGWVIGVGIIGGLAILIIAAIVWTEEDLSNKDSKRQPAHVLYILATGVAVFILLVVVPQVYNPPNIPAGSNTDPSSSGSYSPNYMSSTIKGYDWVEMTYSQKSAWITKALDTLVASGTMYSYERQPNGYYILELDGVFTLTSNRSSSVAWELTAFT